jgi:hypothetical protein
VFISRDLSLQCLVGGSGLLPSLLIRCLVVEISVL